MRKGRRGDGWAYYRADCGKWWFGYFVRGQEKREPGGRTEADAVRKLRARLKEIAAESYVGPAADRIEVSVLLDDLLLHLKNQGKTYGGKLRHHLKPVRAFFMGRVGDVTTAALERYQAERRAAGKAPATINRELEGLRRAFTYAASLNPPRLPKWMIPTIPMLPMDNVRVGFFDWSEITAMLNATADQDVRDVIEWGFRTGMRKGELSRLTWEMLDRSGALWTLNIPGPLTKNRKPRSLPLPGELRTIMDRRIKARRLDTPWIFHRTCKGKPGQQVYDITAPWDRALKAARLPVGRLFHDLRRSAVRTLVHPGVDRGQAMKISGHTTEAMFKRYADIFTDKDTAAALMKAEAYLDAQPTERNVSEMPAAAGKPVR